MHCLPAHRGDEVEPAVIDGRRSIVLEQAANRVPTEQALIHTLISGDWTRDG
jgi:ornithine carbamoyltransferase